MNESQGHAVRDGAECQRRFLETGDVNGFSNPQKDKKKKKQRNEKDIELV